MISKIKIIIASLALIVGFGAPLALPAAPVFASTSTEAACDGIGLTGGSCGTGAESKIYGLLSTVVNTLSIIVGAVAVIMIIVAGFKYITSNGEANNISSAKNTLIYAVVGMFIVVFAQAITRFVFAVSN